MSSSSLWSVKSIDKERTPAPRTQPTVTFFQVLLVLHFLKGSAPNMASAACFFNLSKESYCKQLWGAMHALRHALGHVIRRDARFRPLPSPSSEFFVKFGVLSVADTTEVEIQLPDGRTPEGKAFISANWSGKFRRTCLKFLVVVNIVSGHLCYCSRAYRGAAADINILRHSAIYAHTLPHEKIMGDHAFVGDSRTLAPKHNPPRNVPYHRLNSADKFGVRLHKVRSIVERSISRIKRVCPIFRNTWKYHNSRLSSAFLVGASVTQIHMSHFPVQKRRHPLL